MQLVPLILLVLSLRGGCLISESQLGELSGSLLETDPLIEIATPPSGTLHPSRMEYFQLRTIDRAKRAAYFQLLRLQQRVHRILRKYGLPPPPQPLAQTRLRPLFLSSRRKWSYSLIFAVGGSEEELGACEGELGRVGVERLQTHPSINFLHEKTQALQLFWGAQSRLRRLLRPFPGWGIQEVEKIEIQGWKIENSDVIEQQIEREFSDSEELADEAQFVEVERIADNLAQQGILQMRVVFKVGREGSEDGDDDESENSEEEHDSASSLSEAEEEEEV